MQTILRKWFPVFISMAVLPICFSSCGKDGVKAGYYLSVQNSNISLIDKSNNGRRLSDALVLQSEPFYPDASFRGGYAYSCVMKSESGVFTIASMGHPASLEDFLPGTICSKTSVDQGKTWSASKVMQENIGKINVMHPSLLSLSSSQMLCLFLVKNSRSEINLMCKKGADTGNAWSPLVNVGNPAEGYKITTNGRLFKTKKGRLIIPVGLIRNIDDDPNTQVIYCYISDDLGQTWRKTSAYGCNTSITEPGIAELGDGSLLMCLRNKTGKVFFTTSYDGGETWSNISRSNIDTPESPQAIIYSDKFKVLFMAWNNKVYDPAVFFNRSTLSLAVSHDRGINWELTGDLDKSNDSLYFYPGLMLDKDELVVTYSKYKKNTYLPSIVFKRFDLKKLLN